MVAKDYESAHVSLNITRRRGMDLLRALIPAAVAAFVVFPNNTAADSRNRYAPCCDSAVEYNWSGFFVGGHAAGALSQIDWAFTTPAEGTDHNERAFGGGVHAALQRQWGRTVAGVEVAYTAIDFEFDQRLGGSTGHYVLQQRERSAYCGGQTGIRPRPVARLCQSRLRNR